VTAQAQRGQVHPGRPSLGPLGQVRQLGRAELDAGHAAHQRGRLGRPEPQVAGPDLGQLAGRAHARHRQRGIGAGDENHLGRGR
jgi:hypothetical protein